MSPESETCLSPKRETFPRSRDIYFFFFFFLFYFIFFFIYFYFYFYFIFFIFFFFFFGDVAIFWTYFVS